MYKEKEREKKKKQQQEDENGIRRMRSSASVVAAHLCVEREALWRLWCGKSMIPSAIEDQGEGVKK